MKVLFVDDEKGLLDQAEIFLERFEEELEVDTAASAKKGLEMIEERCYDAIVSDYQMPGMDGLEFLRELRVWRNYNVPFIMFTGKGREEVAIEALNLGADRYIQKGGDPKAQYGVLLDAIKQEVEHYKTKQDLSAKQSQFQNAVQKAPYPAMLHAEDGEVISINDSWTEMTGYEKEDIPTIGWWVERAYGERKESVESEIEELYDIDESIDEGVYDVRTKSGEVRRWRFSSSPVGELPDGRRLVLSMANDVTEQKEAQEKLKESEQKYRNLFEVGPHATFMLDKDGKFTDVNEFGCELTGYSKEEMIGTEVWDVDFFPQESKRKILEKFMEKLEHPEKRFSPYTVKVIRKNGEVAYGEIDSKVIRKDGEIKGVIGTTWDVTEHKETEEALRESEERLSTVVNSSKDGILIHKDGEIRFVNPIIPKELGYPEEELLGMNIAKFIAPEDREKVLERYRARMDDENVKDPYEVMATRKDGSTFPVEVKSTLIEYQDEECALSFIRDISQRKEAEEKLEKIKERYRALFERSLDAVYIHDLEGRFIDANQAALDLLGYEREEIEGLKISDLVGEDQLEKAFETLDEVLKTGTQDDITKFELKTKDGREILMETKSSLIYEDEEPYAVLGIGRDITEREKAQEREEFLHSLLRHDLKNKAQVVRGYLQLVEESDEIPEEVSTYIEKAVQENKESIDLIQKVRLLMDAEEEKKEAVDICSTLKEAVSANRSRAENQGMDMTFDKSSMDCRVEAGSLLKEVFSNLIENAIRHSSGSKIKISGRSEENSFVCRIEDDGEGIPEEKREDVFERGYTTDGERGTGLGLFLVKVLLESYGGEVQIRDSELGGACFEVCLKRAD